LEDLMSVVVVRYRTEPDRSDENQALIEKVFAELATVHPDGLRYMSVRLGDGVSFVHVASIETPDGTNPLSATAAFQEFQREIADRCEEQPLVMDATLVGSYGFSPAGGGHNET
jgi:hypothetical protein